jgi:hypothetical protein
MSSAEIQREQARIESQTLQASCRRDSTLPLCGSFSSEDPQCGSEDEVALQIEGIVDGGVHAEEALGGSSRLEALLLALSLSHGLTLQLGLLRICGCAQAVWDALSRVRFAT